MMSTPKFKKPSFAERAEMAAKAKTAAIDMLRAKLVVDPATIESRRAASAAREAAAEEKRAVKRAAFEAERSARKARALELRKLDEEQPVMTDAERKAARDARYSRRRGR